MASLQDWIMVESDAGKVEAEGVKMEIGNEKKIDPITCKPGNDEEVETKIKPGTCKSEYGGEEETKGQTC